MAPGITVFHGHQGQRTQFRGGGLEEAAPKCSFPGRAVTIIPLLPPAHKYHAFRYTSRPSGSNTSWDCCQKRG
jgi:hypothetical protein